MKEKKNGCCNDLHKFYKLNDSHKNTTNNLNFETGDVAIVTSYSLYNWLLTADAAGRAVQNHSPPDYIRPRACILNCVFRL